MYNHMDFLYFFILYYIIILFNYEYLKANSYFLSSRFTFLTRTYAVCALGSAARKFGTASVTNSVANTQSMNWLNYSDLFCCIN